MARSEAPPLLACVRADQHLVARCCAPGCAREAPCDPVDWVAEGLGGLPLRAFEDRLRCICGARRAALDVRPGPYVAEFRAAVFRFR